MITSEEPLYYLEETKNNFFVKIYFIIIRIYIGCICEFVALYSSCFSGLSCYLLVFNNCIANKLLKILNNFNLVSILTTLLAALIYSYKLLEYEFPSFGDNNSKLNKTVFYEHGFQELELTFSFFFRDIFGIVILFIKITMSSKLILLKVNNKISTMNSVNNAATRVPDIHNSYGYFFLDFFILIL